MSFGEKSSCSRIVLRDVAINSILSPSVHLRAGDIFIFELTPSRRRSDNDETYKRVQTYSNNFESSFLILLT